MIKFSPAVRIYNLAIEKGCEYIVELIVKTEFFKNQDPSLWGNFVVTKSFVKNETGLLVATSDLEEVKIIVKLTGSYYRTIWRIKNPVPIPKMIELLTEQRNILYELGNRVPSTKYRKLFGSVSSIIGSLEDGSAELGGVMKGLIDVQSNKGNRTKAYVQYIDKLVAETTPGKSQMSLENNIEIPKLADPNFLPRRTQTRIFCSDGTVHLASHHPPLKRDAVGVPPTNMTVYQQKLAISWKEIFRYALYISPGKVELFDNANHAFLRAEQLRRLTERA